MPGLFSRKRPLADILEGFCDIHAHLLPGVDDGSPSSVKSIELLRRMEDHGMRRIYLTPHIINGLYGNRGEERLRAEFSRFAYNGNVELHLAAEYMLDEMFVSHVENTPLTMNGYLLAEFPMNSCSMNALNMLFDASTAGYGIIIAHPERYTFIDRKQDKTFAKLVESGYKLQLNLLSLTGFHGGIAKKHAEEFLNAGLYTFAGTDIHSNSYLDTMERHTISQKLFSRLEQLRENNSSLFL